MISTVFPSTRAAGSTDPLVLLLHLPLYNPCIRSSMQRHPPTVIQQQPHSHMAMMNGGAAGMADVCREAQRGKGPASILSIGTASPENYYDQSAYTDFYFAATNSDHKKELKNKFRRICDKSTIKKRHMYLDEAMLAANPSLRGFDGASLDARQQLLGEKVPELSAQAARRAIAEWGRPATDITHLVFCTTGGGDMPGPDLELAVALGLPTTVRRIPLYHQGCFAGGTVLRVAKDLAENNAEARVLVVCCEITLTGFRGMDDAHFDNLIGQALFGDGASAVVVGSDARVPEERPLFEIASAVQSYTPGSDGAIRGLLRECGLTFELVNEVPSLVASCIRKNLADAFAAASKAPPADYNGLFWAVHPGGPAIVDQVEAVLKLRPEKLKASRKVLSEYGNLNSACVLFVLDEVRRSSEKLRCATTGEGLEWGVLCGFGPGVTVETVVLRSMPLIN